jgi:hypothetical protein
MELKLTHDAKTLVEAFGLTLEDGDRIASAICDAVKAVGIGPNGIREFYDAGRLIERLATSLSDLELVVAVFVIGISIGRAETERVFECLRLAQRIHEDPPDFGA